MGLWDWGRKLWNFVANKFDALINRIQGFFKSVFNALKKIADSIAQLLPGSVVAGIKAITARIDGVIKRISRTYAENQVTGEWEETDFEKDINENEVPDWIKAKLASSEEVDTTQELVNELQQAS
jgi:hypothetical protein